MTKKCYPQNSVLENYAILILNIIFERSFRDENEYKPHKTGGKRQGKSERNGREKTERMTVPATDAEKTGQEVKKPAKVAKKEEKIFVEFGGRQILVNDVAESAKAHYKALFEKENGVLKTLELYIKPEENVAYYVANGTGRDEFKVGL